MSPLLLTLFIFGPILILSDNTLINDKKTYTDAQTYCDGTLAQYTTQTQNLLVDLCVTGKNKQCFVQDGYIDKNNGGIHNINDNKKRAFICDRDFSDGKIDMALLPAPDIGHNELVCIQYKYYMAICVLLMIAFASFLCFIVVALNKLKQLREQSYLF